MKYMQPKGVIKGQDTQNITVMQNKSIIRAYCSPRGWKNDMYFNVPKFFILEIWSLYIIG